MIPRRWKEASLAAKLFVSFVVVSLVPIGVMSGLALRHLDAAQAVAVEQTRAALSSSQIGRLNERLTKEAERLATFFFRVQGEAHSLRSFAEAILSDPSHFTYRNGSRYRADGWGGYGNPVNDGNSVLSVTRYSPGMAGLIGATESLDLLMRPLAEHEPRMALAWMIAGEGFARAFPWRDFSRMPREKDYTAWPFYYLADPRHNPSRGETFTAVYLDPLSGEWMISCLSPVYVAGQHRGTVGIDITIDSLLKEIREIRLSPDSASLLVSGSEVIAASGNLGAGKLGLDGSRGPYQQDLSRSSYPAVRNLAGRLKIPSRGVELLDLGTWRAYAAYAAVQPPGWSLVLFVPEESIARPAQESVESLLAETRRVRSNFIHILVFSLLGVIGLTWAVFVHQSRGLRTLLRGIRRLGQGDFAHRIPESGGEFGQLAQALNSTAESLEEKRRELQRVYAEVEQGRKLAAVGRLAAGVAHEVNNPLATISTYVQLLLRRSDLPRDADGDLEAVMAEVRRIQEKLRNLLDLSRLQSPVRTRMDPNALVQEVVGLARHEAAAREIDLRVALDPTLPPFLLDRSGVKQILWNLLANAIDAQASGGSILLRTGLSEDAGAGPSLVLEVEDRGPGIPEAVLPKIFEPFFTTKEVGQGTGLGLAVVYSVVRSHGGRIEVANVQPTGCRFRVTIPEGKDPLSESRRPEGGAAPAPPDGRTTGRFAPRTG